MGAFEYVALDPKGKQSKGLIEGDTPKHVRQILRDRHMLPVQVTEVAQKEAKRQRTFSLRSGISSSELAILTRQLASLSQSGLPLEEALLAVAQQNDQPRTKSIILGVRSRVMEGHTLADGLGEFPQAFPELYRATVAAGEQSGHLIFRDCSTTGDGILAALSLLEIIIDKGKSIHELKGCMQRQPQVLKNIDVSNKIPLASLPDLDKYIKDLEKSLGKTGRVLFRYSGTEKKARIFS